MIADADKFQRVLTLDDSRNWPKNSNTVYQTYCSPGLSSYIKKQNIRLMTWLNG